VHLQCLHIERLCFGGSAQVVADSRETAQAGRHIGVVTLVESLVHSQRLLVERLGLGCTAQLLKHAGQAEQTTSHGGAVPGLLAAE
jgi:hypothetical protein